MALTGALVYAGHHRLRYLCSCDGESGTLTITTTGGATPDLLTDSTSLQGVVRKAAKAFTGGYGTLAAGALTQAQSRAIWLADNTGSNIGNKNIQRCQVVATRRTNPGQDITIDANVDGSGHPTIILGGSMTGAGSFYLDVEAQGVIGS